MRTLEELKLISQHYNSINYMSALILNLVLGTFKKITSQHASIFCIIDLLFSFMCLKRGKEWIEVVMESLHKRILEEGQALSQKGPQMLKDKGYDVY